MTKVGIPDGAFALGTFAAGEAISFPGLVHADGRVVDVSQSWTTLHDVFDDWASAWPALEGIAAATAGRAEHAYGELRPLAPLAHPDVLQAGANFRRHVIDMVVKATQPLRRPALAVLADVEAELAGQLGRVRDLGQKLGSQRP